MVKIEDDNVHGLVVSWLGRGCLLHVCYCSNSHMPFVILQQSFFKQFYGSVTKSDYSALRLGFIMVRAWYSQISSFLKFEYALFFCCKRLTRNLTLTQTHCRGNPKFNFHRYMIRALEADFKTVVGIRYVIFVYVKQCKSYRNDLLSMLGMSYLAQTYNSW